MSPQLWSARRFVEFSEWQSQLFVWGHLRKENVRLEMLGVLTWWRRSQRTQYQSKELLPQEHVAVRGSRDCHRNIILNVRPKSSNPSSPSSLASPIRDGQVSLGDRQSPEECFVSPKLISPKTTASMRWSEEKLSEECSVCCEVLNNYSCDMGPALRLTGCHHGFHVRCMREWMESGGDSCPLCRSDQRKLKMRLFDP